MNQIFSERFKSARLLSGLSLQELADKLENKISRQSLHNYEKGEVIPDTEMLESLCEVFKVRPDFFFRETKVQLGELEFRKLNTLPVKENKRIIEEVKDHLSRYLEIEEILALQTDFVSPLKDFPPITSFEEIEKAAEQVRSSWQLGTDSISNCIELLESHNIKVVEINADDTFDGMQTWVNEKIPVIVFNKGKVKSLDRKRFTVMHELAHLLLPLGNISEKEKEIYCHQFAGAMLFPKTKVINELGLARTQLMIQELGELKKQYGISIQAIVMRAKDLQIISDNYCKKFFFFFKQMGWKVNEPVEYVGTEESTRFNQLIFRALAEEIITTNKAAVLKNQSLSEFRSRLLFIE